MKNNTINYKPNTSNGVKRQKLSDYLDRIKPALNQQDYNKAKRLGETALRKLHSLSYSPRDEYLLCVRLGYAYLNLIEYSRSLDIFYRAYLTSSRYSLPEAEIIYASYSMGYNLVTMKNLDLALAQFQKVEQYYKKYGDNILPMNSQLEASTLLGLGYCYLGKNELEKARDIIENRLPSHKFILSDEQGLYEYNHLRGEYLIATKEYKQARESFQECIRLSEQINSPRGALQTKIHLAVIDLLANRIDDAIKTLRENLRNARRLKLNDLVCESMLILSRCYLLKGMPDKSASIEERIKPILTKLDTVWLYEKTREFEKLYRQLQSSPKSPPVPAVLVKTLNHRHETSPYKEIVIGSSTAMQEVFTLIEKIAPSDLPILIQGETGTGKELIAQAIHANSPRSAKTFLAFNCGAIPESLLESALFGHTRGAFTGAVGDKKGYIELASGGTLFIDEISNMSAGMQQKLLRVLEEDMIWRIGAQKQVAVNTRFIFASNQDIEQMVKQKLFREDLFYRINTIVLNLPALRERREDIPLLVEHFLKKYASNAPLPKGDKGGYNNPPAPFSKGEQGGFELSPSALGLFINYPWPGNIRELENEIQRILVLHPEAKLITESMLSESIRECSQTTGKVSEGLTLIQLRKKWEKDIITQTIKKYNGNIAVAAKQLGYALSPFYRKMKHLKITPEQ